MGCSRVPDVLCPHHHAAILSQLAVPNPVVVTVLVRHGSDAFTQALAPPADRKCAN